MTLGKGYENFFVFDNFGNYLCHTDAASLKEVNTYLLRMLHGQSTRSFYYVDVLAAKPAKAPICRQVIAEYEQEHA